MMKRQSLLATDATNLRWEMMTKAVKLDRNIPDPTLLTPVILGKCGKHEQDVRADGYNVYRLQFPNLYLIQC